MAPPKPKMTARGVPEGFQRPQEAKKSAKRGHKSSKEAPRCQKRTPTGTETHQNTFWTQNRPLRGPKTTPKWSNNLPFKVKMRPWPSLRCSFASPFDLGPNSKRLDVDSSQVSCPSCFRFSLFSNIAHFTKHPKTQLISTIVPSSSLHARCKKEAIDEANHVRKGELHRKTLPTFTSLGDPSSSKNRASKATFRLKGRTKQRCPKKTPNMSQNGRQHGTQNEPKSTPKPFQPLTPRTFSRLRRPR